MAGRTASTPRGSQRARPASGQAAVRTIMLLRLGLFLLPALTCAADPPDITTSLSSLLTSPLNPSLLSPSVRLLTATGSEGAGSASPLGAAGVLFPIDSPTALASFQALGAPGGAADPRATAGLRVPFVAVLFPAMFTAPTLAALSALPWAAGALALDAPPPPFSDAPQAQPPGAKGAFSWNPAGRGLTGSGAPQPPFPLVALLGAESARVAAAAAENGAALASGTLFYPAPWAVALRFYFGPPGLTAPACLAAGSCQPLGGFSAWGWLSQAAAAPGGWNSSGAPGASSAAARTRLRLPGVLAAVALDASSLFHPLSVGADGTVSGLVALLAAAEALGRTPNASSLKRPLLFAAFQGEAWGRLGSRTWAAEAVGGGFTCALPVAANGSASGRPFCGSPVRSDVNFFALRNATPAVVVGVDQVGGWAGGGNGGGGVWARGSGGAGGTRAAAIASAVFAAGAPLCASPPFNAPLPLTVAPASDPSLPLPGTPLRSFLSSPGLLLAGYDGAFTNPRWSSRWDNATSASYVASASTLLARTLWALANDTGVEEPNALAAAIPPLLCSNASLVAALVGCFAVDAGAGCALFNALYGMGALPSGPLSMYTSVYSPAQLLPGPPADYSMATKPQEALVRALLSLWGAGVALDGTVPAAAVAAGSNTAMRVAVPNCSAGCPGGGIQTEGECTLGWCVPPSAWWHDAYSPSIITSPSAGSGFAINTAAAAEFGYAEDPVYAEPLWGTFGAYMLRYDCPNVGVGMFCAGLLATLGMAAALLVPPRGGGGGGEGWLIGPLDKDFRVP